MDIINLKSLQLVDCQRVIIGYERFVFVFASVSADEKIS